MVSERRGESLLPLLTAWPCMGPLWLYSKDIFLIIDQKWLTQETKNILGRSLKWINSGKRPLKLLRNCWTLLKLHMHGSDPTRPTTELKKWYRLDEHDYKGFEYWIHLEPPPTYDGIVFSTDPEWSRSKTSISKLSIILKRKSCHII